MIRKIMQTMVTLAVLLISYRLSQDDRVKCLSSSDCIWPKLQQLQLLNLTNDSQKFYHQDYDKYLNVFVIHHSITGKDLEIQI